MVAGRRPGAGPLWALGGAALGVCLAGVAGQLVEVRPGGGGDSAGGGGGSSPSRRRVGWRAFLPRSCVFLFLSSRPGRPGLGGDLPQTFAGWGDSREPEGPGVMGGRAQLPTSRTCV